MSNQDIIDGLLNSQKNKKPITSIKMQKQCPKCHGNGQKLPMMIVDFPIIPNQWPNHRPNRLPNRIPNQIPNGKPWFPRNCDRCGGRGVVPLIEPVML